MFSVWFREPIVFRYGKKTVRLEWHSGGVQPSHILWKHKRNNAPWNDAKHEVTDQAVVDAIRLYMSNNGFGGMTLEEFVNRTVPRVKHEVSED